MMQATKARPSLPDASPSKPHAMAVAASTRIQHLRHATYATIARAKRGDRKAQDRLVFTAIAISLLVHAIPMAIRFVVAEDKRPSLSPPLEVVLVNSKSSTKPYKAELLAQANLDGGGNTDAKRRAKTPLPILPQENRNTELSAATQRVQALEQQARQLLTKNKAASTVTLEPRRVEAPDPSQLPTAQELMQRTLEAIKLEAQIAQQMEAYQQRPKRRFLGARAENIVSRVMSKTGAASREGRQPQLSGGRAQPAALWQSPADRSDPCRRLRRKRRDQPLVGQEDPRCGGGAHPAARRAVCHVPARHPARHRHHPHHANLDLHARR